MRIDARIPNDASSTKSAKNEPRTRRRRCVYAYAPPAAAVAVSQPSEPINSATATEMRRWKLRSGCARRASMQCVNIVGAGLVAAGNVLSALHTRRRDGTRRLLLRRATGFPIKCRSPAQDKKPGGRTRLQRRRRDESARPAKHLHQSPVEHRGNKSATL